MKRRGSGASGLGQNSGFTIARLCLCKPQRRPVKQGREEQRSKELWCTGAGDGVLGMGCGGWDVRSAGVLLFFLQLSKFSPPLCWHHKAEIDALLTSFLLH